MRQEIDWSVLIESGIELYATATNVSTKCQENFILNNLSVAKVEDILLASSAIPGVLVQCLSTGVNIMMAVSIKIYLSTFFTKQDVI